MGEQVSHKCLYLFECWTHPNCFTTSNFSWWHMKIGYRHLHPGDPSCIVFAYDADELTPKPIYPCHCNRVPGKADNYTWKVQATHLCLNFGLNNRSYSWHVQRYWNLHWVKNWSIRNFLISLDGWGSYWRGWHEVSATSTYYNPANTLALKIIVQQNCFFSVGNASGVAGKSIMPVVGWLWWVKWHWPYGLVEFTH